MSKASESLPSTLQASGGFAFADLGIPREEFHNLRLVTVGHDFFNTLDVEPVAGGTLDRDPTRDSSAVVLNWAAFETLASDLAPNERSVAEAIGRPIKPSIGWLGERPELIGVVEDVHLTTLHRAIEPTAFVLNSTLIDTYYLRIDASEVRQVLARIEPVWSQVFPDAPFDYTFADQSFAAAYRADRRMGTLFAVFAALALFVACLGLFGLAAFTARQRRQEIGVRKAVGASTGQVVGLLSKEFAQLVAVAIVIAVPLAYVGLRQWLDTFAYHVELGAGAFLLAGSCVLLVSLLTVSIQALRAARVDPATTLREE